MALIDTHAHLNFNAFKDDADEVLRQSLAKGMEIINVGSQYSTSRRAVELAEKYPDSVYAAIGLHPIHANDENFNYEKYKKLALSEAANGRLSRRVVAIGEIGLDYKSEYVSFREQQRTILCNQLDLAKELNLPVIFHCRLAHNELIKTIEQYSNIAIRGVVHCFTGTWQEAQQYLEKGFYLGFNGIIFKLDLGEIIKKTPLERILLETDCPYLTPLPAVALSRVEGAKEGRPMEGRNEPLYIKYVAEKIAGFKGETFEKIEEITTKNARKLFNI